MGAKVAVGAGVIDGASVQEADGAGLIEGTRDNVGATVYLNE